MEVRQNTEKYLTKSRFQKSSLLPFTVFFLVCFLFIATAWAQSPLPGAISNSGNCQFPVWLTPDTFDDTPTNAVWRNIFDHTYTSSVGNFTRTGSINPTINNTEGYNYHRTIGFAGNSYMTTATGATYNTSGRSVALFIVYHLNATDNGSYENVFSFGSDGNGNVEFRPSGQNWRTDWGGADKAIFNPGLGNRPKGILTYTMENASPPNNTINAYHNGIPQTVSGGAGTSTVDNRMTVGAINTGGSYRYGGRIQEIIVVSPGASGEHISDTDRNRILSYLAIKYGFTLNYDYVIGNTIVWDYNANSGFNNNIFGIARYDASRLNQVQSKSNSDDKERLIIFKENALALLNPNNSTALNDSAFVMLGSNAATGLNSSFTHNEGAVFANNYELQKQLNFHTQLIYKAQISKNGVSIGTGETVNMKANYPNATHIIVCPDTYFATHNTRIYELVGGVANNVLLNSGDYITFAGFEPTPGGIDMTGLELDLWIDGNHSTSSSWQNLAQANYTLENLGNTSTIVRNSRFNYNREINFGTGANAKLRTTANYTQTAGHSYHYFIVSDATTGSLGANASILSFNNSGSGNPNTSLQWSSSNSEILTARWNGTNLRNFGFTTSNNTKYGIVTMNTVNASAGPLHVYLNGVQGAVYNSSSLNVGNNIPLVIGGTGHGASASNNPFNGTIQEIILIRRPTSALMTEIQIQQIHSCLAIKYGITLPHNYLSSDSTIIWTQDPTYNKHIFGLGRDDNSGLYQKQSASTSFPYLTVYLGNKVEMLNVNNTGALGNKQFLVIGANGNDPLNLLTGIVDSTQYLNGIAVSGDGFTVQSPTFKTQLTGLDSILVRMEAPSMEFSYVLVSQQDDFDPLYTKIYHITKRYTDEPVRIDTDFKFFKFIGFEPGPGGVVSGLILWLRADNTASLTISNIDGKNDSRLTGYSPTSTEDIENMPVVEAWKDLIRGHNYTHADAPYKNRIPVYKPNSPEMNYHPAVWFWTTGTNANTACLHNASGVSNTGSPLNHSAIFAQNSNFNGGEPREYSLLFGGGLGLVSDGFGWGVERGSAGYGLGRFKTSSSDITGTKNTFTTGSTTILSYYTYLSGANKRILFRFNGIEDSPSNNIVAGNISFNRISTLGVGYNHERSIKGAMSEAILYDRELTENERQHIESYLALKYGITLEPDFNTTHRFDYRFSDGTILWKGDTTSGKYVDFYKNIAAVIRDDAGWMHNTHSHSTNTGSILHLGVAGTELNEYGDKTGSLDFDKEAIIFGCSSATGVSPISNGNNLYGYYTHQFDRVWYIRKVTNNDRPISMLVGAQDNSALTIGDDPAVKANYYLRLGMEYNLIMLVADNPTDLAAGNYKAAVPMSYINGEHQCSYLFTEEDTYITFACKENTPCLTPHIEWVTPLTTEGIIDNSAVLTGCIKNTGDLMLESPIFVTFYKNDTIIENMISVITIEKDLEAGEAYCFSFTLKNICEFAPFDSIWVSINDNEGEYPYQEQCETDLRRKVDVESEPPFMPKITIKGVVSD